MGFAPQFIATADTAPKKKRGQKVGKKLEEVEKEFLALPHGEATEATFMAMCRLKSINEEKARKYAGLFLKGLEAGRRTR